MVRRIGGARRKTRGIFSKSVRQKGKFSVSRFFQNFVDGDKVVFKAEPSVQNGMYFRRFHGKIGKVVGKRGKCYKVSVNDRAREKTMIVHPVHLNKVR